MEPDRWVSGMNTGITYRNIYCAVCNGAFVSHNSISKPGTHKHENANDLSAVQFWWTHIHCPDEVADNLSVINMDTVSEDELVNALINR